ncbi:MULTISPECIES: hypothetical protein [unclassified Streptomyces]|uniref:hypothetical protein n=1 Tax=unclassified Streptomyces TaxID=2593676 RepID=UPI0034186059
MTWQPPITLLAGLSLPGPDPAKVDLSRLHQLGRERQHPVQHAAHILGTSLDEGEHVLDLGQPAMDLATGVPERDPSALGVG